jgi:hypothetical protein
MAYKQNQLELQGTPMTNDQIRDFALSLLHADTEAEVIKILTQAGYWDNPDAWRLYGDKEGNWSQVGNQQSFPEASLVEKVVNSVDTRLMLECLKRDIDPEGDQAPTSVRDAVAMFFEGRRATDDEAGTLINWDAAKRRDESRQITIAATGGRPIQGKKDNKKMSLTICDQGEGQSAQRLPNTILSLNAKNKQRIRFVQGKFNMGGSGALRFCGDEGIQLVITRRHPGLAKTEGSEDPTVDEWAVTVVRREEPSDKSGRPVHSEFTYLAPLGSDESPRNGRILSFRADTLPLMPVQDEPYKKEVVSGTAIKLYEYETKVRQSHLLFKGGLLFALERLMPELALPIRMHECRGYKGKEGSYETPLAGLTVRLEDGRGDNLEPGFPKSAKLYAAGTQMTAKIYAFKEERASTYLQDEGVIFQINGQAHGYLPKSIFSRRRKVNLPRLRDSLLVIVDCSALTTKQREDLFMTSRDRLTDNEIRYEVEEEIMEMLKNNSALKQLQQDRRNQDIESKLNEERPLEEVLGKVLRSSPTLQTIFLAGQRLSKPFKTKKTGGSGDNGNGGGGSTDTDTDGKPYVGKRHPTFFDVKGVHTGQIYRRNCELGRRVRIDFKTDVVNDYFDRATDRGNFDIEIVDEDDFTTPNGNFVLDDGDGHLSFSLPPEADVDDAFTLQVTVNDPTLTEPFVNLIRLRVLAKQTRPPGTKKKKKKHTKGGGDKGRGVGIDLPNVITVRTDDEHWQRHHFTPETACHVETDPITDDEGKEVDEHTFFINLDNNSLMNEMKYSKQDVRLLEAKFKYGNVLLGLAMLYDDEQHDEDGSDEPRVQDKISAVTQAVAPVLLPMIDQLSGLEESEFDSLAPADDE